MIQLAMNSCAECCNILSTHGVCASCLGALSLLVRAETPVMSSIVGNRREYNQRSVAHNSEFVVRRGRSKRAKSKSHGYVVAKYFREMSQLASEYRISLLGHFRVVSPNFLYMFMNKTGRTNDCSDVWSNIVKLGGHYMRHNFYALAK